MGDIAQASNGAVTAFSTVCSTSYASCSQSCQGALSSPGLDPARKNDIRRKLQQCNALAKNVSYARDNISEYTNLERMKSQTCGQLLVGDDPQCKIVPMTPQCRLKMMGNCDNPAFAQTNNICICSKNPGDPRCLGAGFKPGVPPGGGGGRGGPGSGSSELGKQGLEKFGGLGGEFSGGIGSGGNPNSGQDDSYSGHKPVSKGSANSGLGGGGGGAPGSPGAGRGGAGSEINTKILSGYGRAGATGAYGSAQRGGSYGGNPPAPGRGSGNGPAVDLRQFLPGGKMDPSRALAGISGPDGITGPNTDIWKKIRSRYFSVGSTLLP
jgi:hypothetical protein